MRQLPQERRLCVNLIAEGSSVDPENTRNQWLRQAMEEELPLIYFFGVVTLPPKNVSQG